MATLIPEYSFEDIVKVHNLGRLRELKSGEVIEDGEYVFTFTNGNNELSGYQRMQAEYNAETSNGVGGKSLQEILGETEIACEDCGKVCVSEFGLQSHMRSHEVKIHASV